MNSDDVDISPEFDDLEQLTLKLIWSPGSIKVSEWRAFVDEMRELRRLVALTKQWHEK